MDFKSATLDMYRRYAGRYEALAEPFQHIVDREGDLFLAQLHGKRILDAGCGPGTYAEHFVKKGFDVTCFDLSPQMVDRCLEKGLDARVMDLEDIHLDTEFDGVWAYASLLHLPKERIPAVVKRLGELLVPGGVFGVAIASW